MLHEALVDYLKQVEQAILRCRSAYVERYVEEVITPERVNLRIRLRFEQGHLLEINEAAVVEEGSLVLLDYRYHCQYRLACLLMNSRKGAATSVLDPFEVEDGWFVLELVAFQVLPADGLADPTSVAVEDTIERLRLNDKECCDACAEYAQEYWDDNVNLDYVTRYAPFVANELRRQNKLRAGDI